MEVLRDLDAEWEVTTKTDHEAAIVVATERGA